MYSSRIFFRHQICTIVFVGIQANSRFLLTLSQIVERYQFISTLTPKPHIVMFLLIYVLLTLVSFAKAISEHPILIIISFDAFRYDYIEKKVTPNLVKLRELGTYADYIINAFPTKTFTNHHTIATGLYAENHGVVGNEFFDKDKKQILKFGYELFHYDETIIPIWRLNEMSGRNRYSGSMMWPGASFEYQGKKPTHLFKFEPEFDWHKRIDTLISWIEDPKKPANLVMAYFEEPDLHGHGYGIKSKEVHNMIQKLDNISMYLQEQLERKSWADKVNVIHLSDHGMVTVSPPKFISLTDYVKPDLIKIVCTSPTLHILPQDGMEEDIYLRLKNASAENGHFSIYKKEEIPSRWRFKKNPRVGPIYAVADEGYAFQDMYDLAQYYAHKFGFKVSNTSNFGVHGYDNRLSSMHPFFIARGPHIKVNHKVPPFNSVDLFSLFCAILNIKPTKHDGSYSNIEGILMGYQGSMLPIIIIVVGGLLLALLFVICVAAMTLLLIKRKQKITTVAALNKRFPQNLNHSVIEAQHLLENVDA